MVNFCVHKNLLFYYCVLSPFIVTCKFYLVLYMIILCFVLVSNICNEHNSTILNVNLIQNNVSIKTFYFASTYIWS